MYLSSSYASAARAVVGTVVLALLFALGPWTTMARADNPIGNGESYASVDGSGLEGCQWHPTVVTDATTPSDASGLDSVPEPSADAEEDNTMMWVLITIASFAVAGGVVTYLVLDDDDDERRVGMTASSATALRF